MIRSGANSLDLTLQLIKLIKELSEPASDAELQQIRELIQLNADVNASITKPNKLGKGIQLPLLHYAIATGQLQLTELLLTNSANVGPQPTGLGYTPLMECARLMDSTLSIHVARLLLQYNVEVNYATSPASETALSLAATRGNLALVELLYEHGAVDVKQRAIGAASLKLGYNQGPGSKTAYQEILTILSEREASARTAPQPAQQVFGPGKNPPGQEGIMYTIE